MRLYFDSTPAEQAAQVDRAHRESARGAEGDHDERAGYSITTALQQVEDEQTASIVQLCRYSMRATLSSDPRNLHHGGFAQSVILHIES